MEKRLKHKKWGKDNIYHKKNKKKRRNDKEYKIGEERKYIIKQTE